MVKRSHALKSFSAVLLVSALSALTNSQPALAQSNDDVQRAARDLADKLERATKQPNKAGAATAAKPEAIDELPKGDPCALLTLAEVRKLYPKADAAKPDRVPEKYGILTCYWQYPTGRLVVQLTKAEPRSCETEARGLAMGFVDPLSPKAHEAVRFQALPGIGDDAVAVVERKDEKRGILGDASYLITQRGDRQIWISSTDLAGGDRAAAIDTLAKLGRLAIGRL